MSKPGVQVGVEIMFGIPFKRLTKIDFTLSPTILDFSKGYRANNLHLTLNHKLSPLPTFKMVTSQNRELLLSKSARPYPWYQRPFMRGFRC